MKGIGEIISSNKHLRDCRVQSGQTITDRSETNRRVRSAFRDSFLGAIPQWEKNLLLEYVQDIPVREGR